jgi:vacuolar-type H+-ATPase subunit F/Vma7
MSCKYIYNLASGIWEDIGQPTATSIQYISGWLVADSNLGKLNNAVNTCYSGVSGCVDPVISGDEQAIYKDLYLISYYGRQATAFLGAAGIDQWLEIKDDVSSIKRQNKNELSKSFIALQKQTQEDLRDKIFAYERNRAQPAVIDMGSGDEIVYQDYVNERNTRANGPGGTCGC